MLPATMIIIIIKIHTTKRGRGGRINSKLICKISVWDTRIGSLSTKDTQRRDFIIILDNLCVIEGKTIQWRAMENAWKIMCEKRNTTENTHNATDTCLL